MLVALGSRDSTHVTVACECSFAVRIEQWHCDLELLDQADIVMNV